MLNTINLKKLTAKTLIGILMVGGFVAQSSNKQAVASNGIYGLELHYRDSAIQCNSGPQGNVKVEVYNQTNDTLLTTLSKGERFATTEVDSVNDLFLRYKVYGIEPCLDDGSYRASQDKKILQFDSAIPTVQGFNGQASITQMLEGLDSYEELYLVELGNSSTSSPGYDLQDVVIVVDNNPNYAD